MMRTPFECNGLTTRESPTSQGTRNAPDKHRLQHHSGRTPVNERCEQRENRAKKCGRSPNGSVSSVSMGFEVILSHGRLSALVRTYG